MSGCFVGCFYYSDSCFRSDCKKGKTMSESKAYKPAHGGYQGTVNGRMSRHGNYVGSPARSIEQQRAIAGGLQEHSVGGIYPLHIVAIANGDEHRYEVHNLQTGKRAMTDWKKAPFVPRSWAGNAGGYDLAHAFAEKCTTPGNYCVWG